MRYWIILIFFLGCTSNNLSGEAHNVIDDNVPFEWTDCVNKLGKTCTQICQERGLECSETCTTNDGKEGWGSQAWFGPDFCEANGKNGGQKPCDHVGDNYMNTKEPRWRCCCGKN